MGTRAFLSDRRGTAQLRVDARIHPGDRVNDFLRLILRDDLGGLRFSLGVLENKPRFSRLASHCGCSDGKGRSDNEKTEGLGGEVWHKKRPYHCKLHTTQAVFYEIFVDSKDP